mgnify:CR=1 FL=1
MDLKKLLGHLENHEDLIKQIEAELGKEYVPRTEFNTKNNSLKDLEKQLADLNENLTTATSEKTALEKSIADLTAEAEASKLKALKSQIAYEKGLPFELAGRLTGDDEKALREDAESLSKLVTRQSTPPLKDTESDVVGGAEDAALKSMLQGLKGE